MILWILACAPPEAVFSTDYTLIWQESFDGEAGSRPAQETWELQTGGGGWGNSQLEHNTNRSENAQLTGTGELMIIAREEPYGGNDYTSARLRSKESFDPIFGRFEARIKVPEGAGLWPAFWLLGSDYEEVSWPLCGEIDIMEFNGGEPNQMFTTVHGPGYSGGSGVGQTHRLQEGSFSDGYFIYSVDIDPEHISWYLDDKLIYSVSSGDLPAQAPWVLDNGMKILLNLAVGGHFVSPPTDPEAFPAVMYVDWVRFWEHE